MLRLEKKKIEPNISSLSLDKFMIKLCTHHQKQFIHVLNNLCTEEQLSKLENISVVSNNHKTEMEANGCTCSESKSKPSLLDLNIFDSQASTNTHTELVPKKSETDCKENEVCADLVKDSSVREEHLPIEACMITPNCTILNHSLLFVDQGEQTVEKKHISCVKMSEENYTFANNEVCTRNDMMYKNFSGNCIGSQKNSRVLPNDCKDSEFVGILPRNSDKENSLPTSPKPTVLDTNESNCKLKEDNFLDTVVINKVGSHVEYLDNESLVENLRNLGASSVPALCKTRLQENINPSKSPSQCKRTPVMGINDYNQCDIVYISQPITECHFDNQRSLVYSRTTAMNSTRGYSVGGECCEMSNVRTLVRDSLEEKWNSEIPVTEAIIIHKEVMSHNALPSAEVVRLDHLKNSSFEKDQFMSLPGSDASSEKTSETQLEQSLTIEPATKTSAPVLSFIHEGKEKEAQRDGSNTVNYVSQKDREKGITELVRLEREDIHKNRLSQFDANSLSNFAYGNVLVDPTDDSVYPVMDSDIQVSLENETLLSDCDSLTEEYTNDNFSLELAVDDSPVDFRDSCADQSFESTSVFLSNGTVQESGALSPDCCSPIQDSETLYHTKTYSIESPCEDKIIKTEEAASRLASSSCKVKTQRIPDVGPEENSLFKNVDSLDVKLKCVTPVNVDGSTMNTVYKGNSEARNTETFEHLQVGINSLTPVNINEESVEIIDNIEGFISVNFDHLKREQSCSTLVNKPGDSDIDSRIKENPNVKCSELVESVQVELQCLASVNNLNGSAVKTAIKEEVYSLLANCSKTDGTAFIGLEKKVNRNSEIKNCDSHTFDLMKIENLEESFETKNSSDQMSISKIIKSEDDSIKKIKPVRALKKESKNAPAPSDRRLRSRQIQESTRKNAVSDIVSYPLSNHTLQVQVPMLSGIDSLQRIVEITSQANIKYAPEANQNVLDHFYDRTTGKNSDIEQSEFRRIICNTLTKDKTTVSEKMFSNKFCFVCKRSDIVKICIAIGPKERRVYFPVEKKDFVCAKEKTSGEDDNDLENECNFEHKDLNKPISPNDSISLCRPSSRKKSMPPKMLIKHNRLSLLNHNMKPSSPANTSKQLLGTKKKISSTVQQPEVSLNTFGLEGSDKVKDKSKFVDWCSEEENQEHISKFNSKYMAIHKGWIPLEKETPIIHKHKNKSDKLKEIWKTKKRVRKNKIVHETQSSPVQMLFMNTIKLSKICKWFLETTETKSLVIVKKLNTRLPEDIPLPMMPIQRYPPSSLYPYTLQAERLKKHLKKFASIFPTCNNLKAQDNLANLFEDKEGQTGKTPVNDTAKIYIKQEPNDCKDAGIPDTFNKPASVQILRKYNNRGKIQIPSLSKKKIPEINALASKTNHSNPSTKSLAATKLTIKHVGNTTTIKSLVINEKQRGRKRSKEDLMMKSGERPQKKRRMEIQTRSKALLCSGGKSMLPTRKGISQLKLDSKLKAQKKFAAHNKILRASKSISVKSKKAKPVVKKYSRKTHLLRKGNIRINGQTKSVKQHPVLQTLKKRRIAKNSSTLGHKKETGEKMLTRSMKIKKNMVSQQQKRKRSKPDSPMKRKRQSLVVK